MHRSRGNFIVLSGLVILILGALAGWWAWNIFSAKPEAQRPVIVDSTGRPLVIGSPLVTEPVDVDLAQNTGENKGIETSGEELPGGDAEVPVPAAVASSNEKGLWIYVDKANFRLYLADGNKVRESWGIAVGEVTGNKQKSGDCRTPEGTFTVQQIQPAGSWTHDFKDGKGVIKGAYGPWFIRLKTGWQGIGIHGTHDPDSIGTQATEGCIRLRNEDLEKLKPLVTVGMKVVIAPNAKPATTEEK